MKKILAKKYVLTVIGVVLGMIGGWLYWKYIGCSTGSCPITASPINSSIWGGAMGGLLLNMLETESKSN